MREAASHDHSGADVNSGIARVFREALIEEPRYQPARSAAALEYGRCMLEVADRHQTIAGSPLIDLCILHFPEAIVKPLRVFGTERVAHALGRSPLLGEQRMKQPPENIAGVRLKTPAVADDNALGPP